MKTFHGDPSFKYGVVSSEINVLNFTELTRKGIDDLIYPVEWKCNQYIINIEGHACTWIRIRSIKNDEGIACNSSKDRIILFNYKKDARNYLYKNIEAKLNQLCVKLYGWASSD